ncbi:MAG: SDR family oxidoreductase [Sphaerochaetaceae bacterium]
MKSYPYGTNVLITGASSGIGLATARLFAQNGYRVWGFCRLAKLPSDVKEPISLISVDVTDQKAVALGVQQVWEQSKGQLGIVIHCAGFGIGGPAEQMPLDQVKAQFETNYFGVLTVNQHLLPLMRSLKQSLVLVAGSVAGRISIPYQSHYSATKFALEAYVEALRIEAKPFGVRACIVEAGDTKTPFTANRRTIIAPDSPYKESALKAISIMEKDEQNGASPEKVARIMVLLARSKRPPVRKVVGFSYATLMVAKRLLPDKVAEKILRSMYQV